MIQDESRKIAKAFLIRGLFSLSLIPQYGEALAWSKLLRCLQGASHCSPAFDFDVALQRS
jgi:hypothetical protein